MNEILKIIRSVLPGIWRYRWIGLVVAVLVGIGGATLILKIPDKYQASARVFVDTQSILKPLMAGLAVQPNIEQQVAMMARTLVNRPNLERVAGMADLDIPPGNSMGPRQLLARLMQVVGMEGPRESSDSGPQREKLVDRLSRDVQFRPAGGNNLYTITFSDANPQNARKVVQSLLNIFVENNLGDKRRDSAQARKFIDEQLLLYENRLVAAENALKDFKLRNLGSMPGQSNDFMSRNADVKRELDEARAELRQAESARDALRREVAMELAAMPADASEADMRRITETDGHLQASRRRLDELLIQYTDRHPDVLNTRETIAILEKQKQAEWEQDAKRKPGTRIPIQATGSAYNAMRASLAEMEAQVASLRAKVSTAQSRLAESVRAAQTVPQVEAMYVQLNRDYETNRKNYDQLLARRESAQLSDNMDSAAGVAEFRIIDPPRVAPLPVSPNRPFLLVMALGASVAAGLGMAFLLSQIRPSFFHPDSLRDATGMPLLGTVSLVLSRAARWRQRLGIYAFAAGTLLYLGVFVFAITYVFLKPALA